MRCLLAGGCSSAGGDGTPLGTPAVEAKGMAELCCKRCAARETSASIKKAVDIDIHFRQ